MTRPRALRLLPGVVLVAAALLGLKGGGLVREAMAGPDKAVSDAVSAPATPANHDYAGDDGEIASAAQVDVLTSLAKRRGELDSREAEIKNQATVLAATEARVDAKIAQLKSLQTEITALLAERDAEQQKQVAALIKTYGPDGMKPANAAAIFNSLPDEVLIPVAQGMKPGDLGAILAKMNPDAAQKLTLKLANKLTLPETTPAAAAPAAPAPAQAAAPRAQAAAGGAKGG